jgi:hypothetical protein
MRIFAALALLASACAAPAPPEPPAWARFAEPERVAIEGYDGEAMEPFLSRDGSRLFFNNRNEPADETDLHWAERIDDLHFRYRGKVEGANSAVLDGVATLSTTGRFCFVSPRSYDQTLATIHCGDWTGAGVSGVQLQVRAAPLVRGHVVFDAELTAGGDILLIADGVFDGGPAPAAADLRLARLKDSEFVLSPDDDSLFASVNTPALEYAAAISSDGLTLSFTRLEGRPPLARFGIWLAQRDTPEAPFGPPVRIEAINGFVEAATFAPDGAIYFHRQDKGRFGLWRAAAR